MKKTREELVNIFKENLKFFREGCYLKLNAEHKKESVKFVRTTKMLKGTEVYSDLQAIPKENRPYYKNPKIYVQNIDTFEKVIEMGPSAVSLNMASYRMPGGGVLKGSSAQEECLCRRSNLYQSLQSVEYPLPFIGGVYTPYVNIFRDADYNVLDEPLLTSVISVAALSHPKLDEDGNIVKGMVRITKNKIRAILRIAILNGHTKLVLGAFGCGAYKNPAKHVAQLFKQILSEDEFKNSFEEICFAILEDERSFREDNKEGNYKPFAEIFNE